MKILTRDTDYAIRAIAELAKVKEGLVNVDELARSTGVPRAFLRKILQTLTRKKVIVSVKGRNGGFRVMNRAGDIKLIELIKIFQGGVSINQCRLKKRPCPRRSYCGVKRQLDRIEKRLLKELSRIKVSHVN